MGGALRRPAHPHVLLNRPAPFTTRKRLARDGDHHGGHRELLMVAHRYTDTPPTQPLQHLRVVPSQSCYVLRSEATPRLNPKTHYSTRSARVINSRSARFIAVRRCSYQRTHSRRGCCDRHQNDRRYTISSRTRCSAISIAAARGSMPPAVDRSSISRVLPAIFASIMSNASRCIPP